MKPIIAFVLVLAAPAVVRAQCPDGTLPPCAGARRAAVPTTPIVPPTYHQLTSSGRVYHATLSPDGRFLAYAEDGALWVRNVADDGAPVPLSTENWRWFYGVQWFPDGSRLLLRDSSLHYSMIPSLGGVSRELPDVWGQGALAPDGRRIANWQQASRHISVRDAQTGTVLHTVRVQGEYAGLGAGSWSPNGRLIALTVSVDQRRTRLQTVSTVGGRAHALVTDTAQLWSLRWSSDGAAIYYLRQTGEAFQLWKQRVVPSTGAAVGQAALVLPQLEVASVATVRARFDLVENGRNLAFMRTSRRANVSIVAAGGVVAPRQLTAGTARVTAARLSPDGSRVAFVNGDAVTRNLYVVNIDSGNPRQLTYHVERQVEAVAWSPDGRRLAYCSNGEGGPQLAVVGVDARQRHSPLALATTYACYVDWLDSASVLYVRDGLRTFSVLPLDGSPERLLVRADTAGIVQEPIVDPTGAMVVYVRQDNARSPRFALGLLSRLDSSERVVLAGWYRPLRWTNDGRSIYAWHLWARHVVRVAVADGRIETVTFPCNGHVADVTADGSRAVCIEGETSTDAWLIRNFDPTAPAAPAPRWH